MRDIYLVVKLQALNGDLSLGRSLMPGLLLLCNCTWRFLDLSSGGFIFSCLKAINGKDCCGFWTGRTDLRKKCKWRPSCQSGISNYESELFKRFKQTLKTVQGQAWRIPLGHLEDVQIYLSSQRRCGTVCVRCEASCHVWQANRAWCEKFLKTILNILSWNGDNSQWIKWTAAHSLGSK